MKTDFPNAIQSLRIETDNIQGGTNSHMFRHDINLSIMPIGGESNNFSEFNPTSTSNSPKNPKNPKIQK